MSKASRKHLSGDDTFDNSVNDEGHKSKRAKYASSSRKDVSKKSETEITGPAMQVDEQGCEFWEISKSRRVQISQYNGQHMVNIREFYEKDGKILPGKKGISLTMAQFGTVLQALPDIESVLAEKGEQLPRPQYESTKGGTSRKDPIDNEGDGDNDTDTRAKAPSVKKAASAKKNFEQTSDEEDDE